MKGLIVSLRDELYGSKQLIGFNFLVSFCAFLPLVMLSFDKYQVFVTVFCVVLLFITGFVNKYLFCTIAITSIAINATTYHVITEWGQSSLKARIQAGYLSPSYEILEYIQSFFGTAEYALLALTCSLFILIIYYLFFIRETLRVTRFIAILILPGLFMVSTQFWFFYNKHPFQFTKALIQAREWKDIVDRRSDFLNARATEKKEPINSQYDKIILILGESVNRDRMGAYGYKLKTTPFLSELLESGKAYSFDNAISPANQTRYSVPLMLTDAAVSDFSGFTKSVSILTKFNDRGFDTHWLSNQFMSGMHDSYIASIASEAQNRKVSHFVYEHGGSATTSYDAVLVNYLSEVYSDSSEKSFVVLHMLGSHFQYKKRYPAGLGLTANPYSKSEHYDNTIYYTDMILRKIHKLVKDEKVLWIFTADHGQVVSGNVGGHGFYDPSYNDEYTIPLIAYSSIKNVWLDGFYKKYKNELLNLESLNRFVFSSVFGTSQAISQSDRVIAIDPANKINYLTLSPYSEVNSDVRKQ